VQGLARYRSACRDTRIIALMVVFVCAIVQSYWFYSERHHLFSVF